MPLGSTKASKIGIGISTSIFGIILPAMALVINRHYSEIQALIPFVFWISIFLLVTGVTVVLANIFNIDAAGELKLKALGQEFPIVFRGPVLLFVSLMLGAVLLADYTKMSSSFDYININASLKGENTELINQKKTLTNQISTLTESRDVLRYILGGPQLKGEISLLQLSFDCGGGKQGEITKWYRDGNLNNVYDVNDKPLLVGLDTAQYEILRDDRSTSIAIAQFELKEEKISGHIKVLDWAQLEDYCLEKARGELGVATDVTAPIDSVVIKVNQ